MTAPVRPHGFTHAASALRNLERKQAVIANNLANVSTAGFKGEKVFARMLENGAAPVLDSTTDMRSGAITTTNQPLDLAILRDGFFVAETERGERLTRGGALSIDDTRRLVDAEGNAILGEDDPRGGIRGPVIIPEGAKELRIDSAGAVIVDGEQVARLRVERPANNARLEHEGGGRFVAPADRERIPVDERSVRQGALEESNVGSIESLVDLIGVQRAYSSVQKVLTTMDFARGITVSDIAKPV